MRAWCIFNTTIKCKYKRNKQEGQKKTLLRHPVPGPPIVTVVQWKNVEGCPTNRHTSASSSCRTSKTNNSQLGLAINGFFSCASTNIFETGATKTSNCLPEYIWTMATPPSKRKQLVANKKHKEHMEVKRTRLSDTQH